MVSARDFRLIETVIRHCQITQKIKCTDEALKYAKNNGFMDAEGRLTYSGRTVAAMMLTEVDQYQDFYKVEVTKMPDFYDHNSIAVR